MSYLRVYNNTPIVEILVNNNEHIRPGLVICMEIPVSAFRTESYPGEDCMLWNRSLDPEVLNPLVQRLNIEFFNILTRDKITQLQWRRLEVVTTDWLDNLYSLDASGEQLAQV